MAVGDITLFQEFVADIGNGVHNLESDVIKCAILDNTVTPTAATATPRLSDFTEVGTAGSYVAGGTDITATYSQTSGTGTFDGTTNPSWAQNASNDTDAWWGLIYNDTTVGDIAIGFVELGGPVDMSAGSLTITWNASGIFTLA